MNVHKTEFVSMRQKRRQGRRQKIVGSFFSGYHTISKFTPSAACFKLSLPKQLEDRNQLMSCSNQFSASFPGADETVGPKSPQLFSSNAQTAFNLSRKRIRESTTSTSLEFQKLLEPFHNFKRENNETIEDFCEEINYFGSFGEALPVWHRDIREESLDSVFQKKRVPIIENKNQYEQTTSEILQNSSFTARKEFDQYNIFNLPVPKNQKSIEEVLNPKNGFHPGVPEEVLPSPNGQRRSFSSSASAKTPKSRSRKSPKTSGSSKTMHSDSGAFILAVTEGRGHARGEVGIAAMDPKRPHLILCQISDGQRYVHSLAKMNVFDFVEVIVPHTFVDCATPTKLYCDIRSTFPKVTLTNVQRRHFSEAVGVDLIKQYCSVESTSVMVLLRDKFYALSAAAALIKYVEFAQNVRLAPQSLRIEYQGTEDTMIIDLETANRLELVACVNRPEVNLNHSLLGVVKHCHTKGGVRLMRANILQPPCSLAKIETRLDCVEELVANPLLLCAVEAAVASFANLETLLNLCMHAPQQDGLRAAECQLKYTLLLKTMLELLPVLRASLQNSKSDYFCRVRENLNDPRYSIILDRILQTVLENAKTVKGSVAAHLHGCFAIKTGINSLLDIAKKTYCEIVQEISDHVAHLRETYNMSLRIAFSSNKGFHIQYTLPPGQRGLKESSLPKEFILVQKSKSKLSFYTAALVALDQRSQNVLDEIKLMTNVVLFQLLTDIRQHVGCLFNLCEDIAELDVLISFAHVSSGTNFARPKFGEELRLKNSRHPILDVIHDGEVVPNDAFAKAGKNFVILTGPNQSGKSIYIRQIALLQIMAQIGCFVPAQEATFRLTDRIFSRIGFDDSIESNACTLIVEMRDVEYLRQNMTARSLVIVDELCRGTSVDEGTSLAFAVCEELLDSLAFVFFTTHFLFLTKLEEMYFNVTNYHFESKVERTTSGKPSLRFTHSRKPGVTKADLYGLQVAEMTSFPKDVYSKAKEISANLTEDRKPSRTVKGLLPQYELSLRLRNELVKYEADLEWPQVESVIGRYRELYSALMKREERAGEPEEPIKPVGREGEKPAVTVATEGLPRDSCRIRSPCLMDGATANLFGSSRDAANRTFRESPKKPSTDVRSRKRQLVCDLAKSVRNKYKNLNRKKGKK